MQSPGVIKPTKSSFHINSGSSQGSSSNSLADFLLSGSHWSICCTKRRNSSLSFPSIESTEPSKSGESGIRSSCLNFPGDCDQREVGPMLHTPAETLPSESKKGPP